MKKLIFSLLLSITLTGCIAQDLKVKQLPVGHTIGLVTQVAEGVVTLETTSGPLELQGKLDKGVEYDVIYEIVETGKITKGILIDSEISFRELRKRKARLLVIMQERNRPE